MSEANSQEERFVSRGRIVRYVLTEDNAKEINRRRVAGYGHGEGWSAGAQAHVGNAVIGGEHVSMIVTAVWSLDTGCVNGQCLLDGSDSLWVTSVLNDENMLPGTWHWPGLE
jgi:hypothetical protein